MTESIFGIQQYQSQNSLQTDKEYGRMLKVLTKAMQGELTQRQYDCMYAYYFDQYQKCLLKTRYKTNGYGIHHHRRKRYL